jgi:1,4-alpha-glucan branching enzyme
MEERSGRVHHEEPLSIYEVHPGSWKRKPGQNPGFLSYRELADDLVPYVKEMGFTHIELMPVAEHPYDPSWGYQITGYFAPTSRFGNPDDLRYFIDKCHQENIGVIVDWVPAHFTKDEHGLRRFDGSALYEHDDPRQGEHRDWGTCIFNFGRVEVKNFLLSNAIYWLEEFHIDGLRVDAVASMLYLDYSREEGEWIPNQYGGRENIEAIHFLRRFNEVTHDYFPGVLTFAEESTSWGGVSQPTSSGGLGFDFKWNMGWMNDTLSYIEKDPIFRKYHQDQLTFSLIYAFSEQFVLPLSHDEVVHMKQSLLSKMPGDDWQKFANLRLLYTYMFGHPGKKLLFMGGEFAQWDEWTEAQSIDWHLLQWETHQGIQNLVKDLNKFIKTKPALYEVDSKWEGFEWIDLSDADNSLLSFIRRGKKPRHYSSFILQLYTHFSRCIPVWRA